MTMLEVSVLDYALSNILSFFAGVFLGLGICACHKERFMQRARSIDNLEQFNHQHRIQEPAVILASAPKI